MRSRWMTVGITLAALMLMLPVVAMAQTSRVESMALQGDYIKDYTAIYTYPACLTSVGNLMYAELGNLGPKNSNTGGPFTTDRAVGTVNDKLFDGKFGVWGIHLHEETPQLGQGDAFSQPAAGRGADPNLNTNEGFDVMWGHKSGTTSLGLRLNRTFRKVEVQTPGVTTIFQYDNAFAPANLSRNIMGFGAGVSWQMNSQTNVDLAGEYQSRTYEDSQTGVRKNTDNGPTTYQVAARAMMQWKPNVVLVPVVKISSFDLSQRLEAPIGTITQFDNSLRSWQLGIASNWTLGTNDLMVWGVTFAQNKLEEEQNVFGLTMPTGIVAANKVTITESIFPEVFAALETHVNNWLTLRFGAKKGAFEGVKFEDKTTGNTNKQQFSSFVMHIGAGVKVGQLQLDAILADNFAQNLGWLGSGVAGTYFPKVTATYAF